MKSETTSNLATFRDLLARGITGPDLEAAQRGAVQALVADVNELAGRATASGRALTLSVASHCRRCALDLRGSAGEPAEKDRHAAFALVAGETAVGIAAKALLAKAAEACAATGSLVSGRGGVSHPDVADQAAAAVESQCPALEALIQKTDELAAANVAAMSCGES